MNAIELLKADHEKVRGLFEQLCDTTKRAEKTRTQLLEQLRLAPRPFQERLCCGCGVAHGWLHGEYTL